MYNYSIYLNTEREKYAFIDIARAAPNGAVFFMPRK